MDHTRAGSVVVLQDQSGHTVADTARWWRYRDGVTGEQTAEWKGVYDEFSGVFRCLLLASHSHYLLSLSASDGMIHAALKPAFFIRLFPEPDEKIKSDQPLFLLMHLLRFNFAILEQETVLRKKITLNLRIIHVFGSMILH